jgi:hypothetical protein
VRRSIIAALFWLVPTIAAAQAGTTTYTSTEPIFLSGQLQGCTIVFDVVRTDVEYFDGKPVQASGAVTLFAFPGKLPSVGVKLGIGPIGSESELRKPYQAPADLFLTDGTATNAPDARHKLKEVTPGYGLFPFAMGDKTIDAIGESLATGRLHLVYAMTHGGVGAPLTIDFRSNLKDGAPTEPEGAGLARWNDCVQKLLSGREETGRDHALK